jgi:hypothetical protein
MFSAVFAAVPQKINVNGRFDTPSGIIEEGVDFHINLYNDSHTLLGTYNPDPSFPISTGISRDDLTFNIPFVLIDTLSGSQEFLQYDNYWLKINRGSIAEPPQRLVAVPFALTARNVKGGSLVVSSTSEAPITATYTGIDPASAAIMGSSSTPLGTGIYGNGPFGFGVYGSGEIAGVLGSSPGVPGINTVGIMGNQDNPIALVIPPVIYADRTWVPVGAVAGSAAGGFPGVSGLSNYGYGVYGTTSSPTQTAGVGGFSSGYVGHGVWGNSPNGIGVYGYGPIAVSGTNIFGSSLSGIGVKGESPHSIGVYGTSINGPAGITGESFRGSGVTGLSHNINKSGIYGVSDIPGGIGVTGNSTNYSGGPGVQGFSESNISAGVYGRGSLYHGVIGSSEGYGSDNFAGVVGINTTPGGIGGWFNTTSDNGPALEIGPGKISIEAETLPVYFGVQTNIVAGHHYNSYVTGEANFINKAAGSATFIVPAHTQGPSYPENDEFFMTLKINNNYIKPNSLVLISPGGYVGYHCGDGYAGIKSITQTDGRLTILVDARLKQPAAGVYFNSFIDFLIINPLAD